MNDRRSTAATPSLATPQAKEAHAPNHDPEPAMSRRPVEQSCDDLAQDSSPGAIEYASWLALLRRASS
jgi:hypothetical protein